MLPLSDHAAFRATTINELSAIFESRLGNIVVLSPGGAKPCDARANHCALPAGDLWASSSAHPITLKLLESDHIRLQFRHAGSGRITSRGEQVAVTAATACVSSGEAIVESDEGFERLVWQIPKAFLERQVLSLTGGANAGGLIFEPTIDLGSPEGRNLQNIVSCLVNTADLSQGPAARIVLTELEQAVAVALLCASDHNQRQLLDRDSASAAPWQVQRVESYIEANWHQPLSMEDIAAVSGASARSIFRSFAHHRGYSPMTFLKRIRLQQAQTLLLSGDPALTVTEVALSCGFGELSRFSKDYRAAFGELPSRMLKRQRGGAIRATGSPAH